MRVIAFVFLIVLLIGCGESSRMDQGPDPITSFARLPSPSELAAMDTDAAGTSRSVSSVVRFQGNSLHLPLPHPGAFGHTEGYCEFLGMGDPDLAYAFYKATPGQIWSTHTLTGISAHYAPSGVGSTENGLWIGLPDWDSDRWRWFSPQPESDWLDVAYADLHGTDLSYYMAVVNYQDTDVTVFNIQLASTTGTADDTDDWLYYVHPDLDFPEHGDSISRIRVDSGEVQLIASATDTTSNCRPYIAGQGGALGLDYGHFDGDRWHIRRTSLTGGMTSVVRADAEFDVLPAGWSWPGEAFLFLRSTTVGADDYLVGAVDYDTEEWGYLYGSSKPVYDACWNYQDAHDYACLVSRNRLGQTDLMLAYTNNLGLGVIEGAITENSGPVSAMTPKPFMVSNCVGYYTFGVSFCIWDPGGWQIYLLYNPHEDDEMQIVFDDPDADLKCPAVSPDGSRLAFIANPGGGEDWNLYLTRIPEANREDWTLAGHAVLLVEDVKGGLCWYDPPG